MENVSQIKNPFVIDLQIFAEECLSIKETRKVLTNEMKTTFLTDERGVLSSKRKRNLNHNKM